MYFALYNSFLVHSYSIIYLLYCLFIAIFFGSRVISFLMFLKINFLISINLGYHITDYFLVFLFYHNYRHSLLFITLFFLDLSINEAAFLLLVVIKNGSLQSEIIIICCKKLKWLFKDIAEKIYNGFLIWDLSKGLLILTSDCSILLIVEGIFRFFVLLFTLN